MAKEQFNDWTKNTDGTIKVCPLTGWSTAVFQGMGAVVRIEFAPSPDQLGKQHESLQLVLNIAQACEFGEALMKMAQHLDRGAPPGTVPS